MALVPSVAMSPGLKPQMRFSALNTQQHNDAAEINLKFELAKRVSDAQTRMRGQTPLKLLAMLEEIARNQKELSGQIASMEDASPKTPTLKRLKREYQVEQDLQAMVETHIVQALRYHGRTVVSAYQLHEAPRPEAGVTVTRKEDWLTQPKAKADQAKQKQGFTVGRFQHPSDKPYRALDHQAARTPDAVMATPVNVKDVPTYVLNLMQHVNQLEHYEPLAKGFFWQSLAEMAGLSKPKSRIARLWAKLTVPSQKTDRELGIGSPITPDREPCIRLPLGTEIKFETMPKEGGGLFSFRPSWLAQLQSPSGFDETPLPTEPMVKLSQKDSVGPSGKDKSNDN